MNRSSIDFISFLTTLWYDPLLKREEKFLHVDSYIKNNNIKITKKILKSSLYKTYTAAHFLTYMGIDIGKYKKDLDILTMESNYLLVISNVINYCSFEEYPPEILVIKIDTNGLTAEDLMEKTWHT